MEFGFYKDLQEFVFPHFFYFLFFLSQAQILYLCWLWVWNICAQVEKLDLWTENWIILEVKGLLLVLSVLLLDRPDLKRSGPP